MNDVRHGTGRVLDPDGEVIHAALALVIAAVTAAQLGDAFDAVCQLRKVCTGGVGCADIA